MKKLFSLLAICLISLFAFAGCGVQGGTIATGIEFVRDVFYVDYNVETFLDYKVYPSTAKEVFVTYDIRDESSIRSYYSFTDGYVKITNSKFTSINVTAKLNTYEDTCEVRLREYPSSVTFATTTDEVVGGLVYSLDLIGAFIDGNRACENDEFVYKIKSSNPSVIDVISEERLLVKSTGRRGESRITVQICNSNNEEITGLTASITLKVVDAISECFATFGNDFVITDGLEKDISSTINQEYKIDVKYFDESGYLIELADFDCYLSNDDVFEIVKKSDGIYLKVVGEGEVVLTIQSNTVDTTGNPVRIQSNLQVQFL